jgi:hypothetical protein
MPENPPPAPENTQFTMRGLPKRGTVGALVVGAVAGTDAASKAAATAGEGVVRVVGASEIREDGQRRSVDPFSRELDDGHDDPRIHKTLQRPLSGGPRLRNPYRVDALHRDLAERYEDFSYHVDHRCSEYMGIKRRCGVRWENIHDPESSTTVSSYSNRLRIASANPSDSSMLDIIIFRLCPPPLATRTLPSPTRDSVTDFLS